MTESPRSDSTARRRWINLGEIIALAALTISALGLWNSWKSDQKEAPQREEAEAAIPIALKGEISPDGKSMSLAPVEPKHSLESLTLTAVGQDALSVGSSGRIAAEDVQRLVGKPSGKEKNGTLNVKIDARYIEAGQLKRGGARYRITYIWDDGGLFGGRKLRLAGFGRS